MGRTYAGILGPLGMMVAIARGLKYSAGVESTLSLAVLTLLVFAALGYVLGNLAAWTVEESVRTKLAMQVAASEAAAAAKKQPA